MHVNDNFTPKLQQLIKAMNDSHQLIANEAVKFYKKRFNEQGWKDTSLEPWKNKQIANGYKTLHGKSKPGLMDSIYVKLSNRTRVVICAPKPYAQAHNEGLNQAVSIREHSRRSPKSNKEYTVKAHLRNMKLPKRQFMGPSKALFADIKEQWQSITNRIFNS